MVLCYKLNGSIPWNDIVVGCSWFLKDDDLLTWTPIDVDRALCVCSSVDIDYQLCEWSLGDAGSVEFEFNHWCLEALAIR